MKPFLIISTAVLLEVGFIALAFRAILEAQ